MKCIKFLLTVCVLSIAIAGCGNDKESPKKSNDEVQKDWSERNKSNKDFDSHESKGF